MQATTIVAEPTLEPYTEELAGEYPSVDQPLPRAVAYIGIGAVSAMLWWSIWQVTKLFH